MKKDLELYWLEQARSVRPDLFAGNVLSHEAPDFVLQRDGFRHGVELTRYVNEPTPGEPIGEEQTGLRRKLLALAKNEFATHSTTKLRVGVVFHGTARLRAVRLPSLAKNIAKYLSLKTAGSPEWSHVKWDADDDDDFPPELSTLFATVVPSIGNTHWYPAQAGWVSNADSAAIRRIVAAKEKNVERYRQQCDDLSLVIVFEGTPHSARAVHAPEEPIGFAIPTQFDRVLCLDVLEKRLVDVPVRAAA
jgi:hypothetical protein